MNTEKANQQSNSIDGSLEVQSWDRPRSTRRLLGFITRREAAIADIENE